MQTSEAGLTNREEIILLMEENWIDYSQWLLKESPRKLLMLIDGKGRFMKEESTASKDPVTASTEKME